MLRLIRRARSPTISNRTKRWRWRGELTRKMIGVIPAFGVLKRLMMPSLLPCWFSNEGGRRVAVTNIERYPGIHTVSIRAYVRTYARKIRFARTILTRYAHTEVVRCPLRLRQGAHCARIILNFVAAEMSHLLCSQLSI